MFYPQRSGTTGGLCVTRDGRPAMSNGRWMLLDKLGEVCSWSRMVFVGCFRQATCMR